MTTLAGKPFSQLLNLNTLDELRMGGILVSRLVNQVEVCSLDDLPDPVLKDGVLTIILEDKQYQLMNYLQSSYPLAFPGAGNRATWTTVNGAIYDYTGPDACFRDKDAQGNIEVFGQAEFHAFNGNMFDIDAVSGSWGLQAVTTSRFRNCRSLGTVSGGASGAGALNAFFGTFSNFYDGLVMDNVFFAEKNTMFVDGNNAAQLGYKSLVTAFTVGETVTGGTSGATAVVEIDKNSATLVVTSVVGTFQDSEALTGSSGGSATVDGALQNTVMFTIQGTETSGSINFLTTTFFASENETLWYFNPEILAKVSSINLRGNQTEGLLDATAFAPGSLTQKSNRVFASGNTFFPDSKTIGSFFVKDNANATSIAVNGTFNDIDFGTLSEATNIERFTLLDASNGEMRYDGNIEFDGEIFVALSAFSSGGARVFTFKYVVDRGAGFVDLPDLVVTEVEIGAEIGSSALLVPVILQPGDIVKPQSTRDAGTSTVTVKQFSQSIQ